MDSNKVYTTAEILAMCENNLTQPDKQYIPPRKNQNIIDVPPRKNQNRNSTRGKNRNNNKFNQGPCRRAPTAPTAPFVNIKNEDDHWLYDVLGFDNTEIPVNANVKVNPVINKIDKFSIVVIQKTHLDAEDGLSGLIVDIKNFASTFEVDDYLSSVIVGDSNEYQTLHSDIDLYYFISTLYYDFTIYVRTQEELKTMIEKYGASTPRY